MKSIIKKAEKENAKPKYPYLAEFKSRAGHSSETFTVLFIRERCGTVVNSKNRSFPIGMYLCDWFMEYFHPIPNGTQIILEQ
jgi:hypothetical protein